MVKEMTESMLERIKRILLYAGQTREEYSQMEGEILNSNKKNLLIFSKVAALFMCGLLIWSFYYSGIAQNRPGYIVAFILNVLLFGLCKMYKDAPGALVHIGIYLFMTEMYCFGIFLSISNSMSASTSFIALLMVIPLLFTDKPVRMNCSILLFCAIFLVLALHIKTGFAKTSDMVNVITFGLLSCVVNTCMMVVKIERVVLVVKMREYAELDVLTGIHNRNCYENRIDTIADSAKQYMACVYMDANGLHDLNNAEGHAAGDRMICTIANLLADSFGFECAFRIGGDEFIGIALDWDKDDVLTKIKQIDDELTAKGYHVSIGVAHDRVHQISMYDLTTKAEQMMYEEKRKFYEKIENDRRKEE